MRNFVILSPRRLRAKDLSHCVLSTTSRKHQGLSHGILFAFVRARLLQFAEKSRPICGSRLQPRHKCLAINWALAPEELPFDFFRKLFSRAVSALNSMPVLATQGVENGFFQLSFL
jgi:hypothetical protein